MLSLREIRSIDTHGLCPWVSALRIIRRMTKQSLKYRIAVTKKKAMTRNKTIYRKSYEREQSLYEWGMKAYNRLAILDFMKCSRR